MFISKYICNVGVLSTFPSIHLNLESLSESIVLKK